MTYSIVAIDPDAGEMGVAVQTALPFVGTLCPWGEAGVGVVATQAWVRVAHGPDGLHLMRSGFSAQDALNGVLAADENREVRQVAMLDAKGTIAAHTGANTIRYAGHELAEHCSAQANMMASDTVPGAMVAAFQQAEGALVFKILAALDAAQAEGGDFRGQQSAGLRIVTVQPQPQPWMGILYDLRVDDHPSPLKELRRLAERQHALRLLGRSIEQMQAEDFAAAQKIFTEAIALDPESEDLHYSYAVTLADEFGRYEEAVPLFRALCLKNPMWQECLVRMAEAREFKRADLVARLTEAQP